MSLLLLAQIALAYGPLSSNDNHLLPGLTATAGLEDSGGGGGTSGGGALIDFYTFNDSARYFGYNSSTFFSSGETVYYTICVDSSEDPYEPLAGDVEFSREDYTENFQIDGCYNGTFVVAETDH